MASVALAIERAAPQEGLWWESHRELLEDLEDFVADEGERLEVEEAAVFEHRLRKRNELEERVEKHQRWLLGMLLSFKPPNAASNEALKDSKITVGSRTLEVKPELRNPAIQISKHLDLDEIQSYLLLTRYLEEESSAVDDPLFLQNVTMTYFLERQCLLKCTRLLLTVDCMPEKVQALSQKGLEKQAFLNLKQVLSSSQPQQWDPALADAWAEETVTEQTLLMDIVFLIYSGDLSTCKGEKWRDLLQTFQELVFEARNSEKLAVTQEAEIMVLYVRSQALLVLIEALDLRTVLTLVHGETPFSQGNHGFSIEELQELDPIVSALDPSISAEYSPILLAWATFICLVSALPDQAMVLDIEHAVYAQQAYKSGANKLLLEVLRSEQLKDSDVSFGYKGTIKTLTSSCLAAYDFCQETSIQGQLIELLCESFEGQEALCTMFWDKEAIVDGPIRSFLYSLRDEFPQQMLPLLRLLSCLCSGSWPAECVYEFLWKSIPVTCLFRPSQEEESFGSVIHVSSAIQIPNCSGLYIPAGAAGRILKRYNDEVVLVRWECEHSCLVILLVSLAQWPRDNVQDVISIVKLLSKMLSSNRAIAYDLLNVDKSLPVTTARADGRMDKSLSIDIIKFACSVIKNLLVSPGQLEAIAESVNLLQKFVNSCPEQVMSSIEGTGLLGSSSISNSKLFSDQYVQVRISKHEQSLGRYFLTMAVVDMATSFLEKGVRVEALSSFILYAMHNILVNHTNWKFTERHERWCLASKIFRMLRVVLGGPSWDVNDLRGSILETILSDTIIHSIIFQILTVSAQNMEELYLNRLVRVSEIDALLEAKCTVFELIDTVLVHVTNENGALETAANSVFCQSLLHKTAGSTSLVNAIASYLGFQRCYRLQVSSARILGRLCEIGQRTRPQAVNLASYVSNVESRKQMRMVMEKTLSEKCAYEQPVLFDAVISFLTSAITCQPGMVEVLLFPWDAEGFNASESKSTEKEHLNSEILDAMWSLFLTPITFSKRYLEVMYSILLVVLSIWQGGTECWASIEVLRNYKTFWETLSTRVIEVLHFIDIEDPPQDQAVVHGICYRCQAVVYQIMTYDIFIQSHVISRADDTENGKSSTESRNVLRDWTNADKTRDILHCYVTYKCTDDFVYRTKAEARTFVIGLLVKIMSGDTRGMDVSFVRHLQQFLSQILLHQAFKELWNHYTSRGYRFSGSLEQLIMGDLYYNLQGQLEGREISNNRFQQLADFLADINIDMALVPASRTQPESENPAFRQGSYDVNAVRSALGLEAWNQYNEIVTVKAAENVLYSLERANEMIEIGNSQLYAVGAFSDLLKMFGAEKGATKEDYAGLWTPEKLSSVIEHISITLEEGILRTGRNKDRVLFLPKFAASHSKLLSTLLWQYVINPDFGSIDPAPVCAAVIKTSFTCIKYILDSEHAKHVSLKDFFGCLLIAFEVVSSRDKSSRYAVGDITLGFLQLLCNLVNNREYRCLSLATINIVISSCFDPSTWIPILQAYFPTKSLVSSMGLGIDEDDKTWGVIMSFCLYLSRFKSGAEMLFAAGLLQYILMINHRIREDYGEGPFSASKAKSSRENFWSLGVAILASLLRALGDNEAYRAALLDSAVSFFRAERQRLLSALCAPNISLGSQGRRMVKHQRAQTSSASLQEALYVSALLCELIRHRIAAVYSILDEFVEVREMVVHLLAYIAREGVVRSVSGERVICPPIQKQEILAHGKSSLLGSTSAWFLVSAKGSSVKAVSTSGNELATVADSQYTESIAIQVYKLVNLLLRFLVIQVRQALQDIEEGRSTGMNGFPELPAPEILHALQDQIVVVTSEISRSKQEEGFSQEVQSACFMLLSILEKSLYLEACISRICGLTPVSLRADDFAREFKGLLRDAEAHASLETSLASVKEIVAVVYPGALI